MKRNDQKLELICEKWAPMAQEYAKFLNRYKLSTISMITKRIGIGYHMAVFADEKKYLELSMNNARFIQEEKQINQLLDMVETLYALLVVALEDEDDYETYNDNEDEYYEDSDYEM